LKGKEIVKLYGALIVIVLVIGQARASHKEGVTTVEVKIVRIVIAQKEVNVSLHLFIKNLLRDIVYAWFQANCSSTSGLIWSGG
jgi:hypothetical protein